jgi:hypothetical protein
LALIVLTAGCAARSTEANSALGGSGASALARESDLKGTWRGSFGQVMTGDSGQVHGDIVTRINDDGTYKTTWTTKLVAGSSRGGRLEMAGTVVADGSYVKFTDARSGARITLRRDGDALYGVTIDPAGKRVTVAIDLHKVSPSPEAP